jgi:streptomycin 6-kinase
MKVPPFAQYRRKWGLVADGSLSETPTSWLVPVRQRGRPTMLKMLKSTSDERAAASLLRYFSGTGAVQLIAADDDGLLMERVMAIFITTMSCTAREGGWRLIPRD